MSVTMRQMLEAGVHFGHQTRFWNPKMAPYIFGHRNKIHIINLEKTLVHVPGSDSSSCASSPPTAAPILFVGTKRQAREIIAEEAGRCRHALRRRALARRHADQLQDRQGLDQAAEGHGAWSPKTARSSGMSKKEGLMFHARAREARAAGSAASRTWPACPTPVRHRRRLPQDRGHRGAEARHPDRGRGRHQPLARRHRLRDPGQRRLRPRDPPLCPRRGRRHPRRPQPLRCRTWSRAPRRTSSSRSRPKRPDRRRGAATPARGKDRLSLAHAQLGNGRAWALSRITRLPPAPGSSPDI